MAASVRSFVIKAVKSHIPMIKFPERHVPVFESSHNHTTPSSSSAITSTTKPTSSMEFGDLPNKYKRRTLAEEEIVVIQNGGWISLPQ